MKVWLETLFVVCLELLAVTEPEPIHGGGSWANNKHRKFGDLRSVRAGQTFLEEHQQHRHVRRAQVLDTRGKAASTKSLLSGCGDGCTEMLTEGNNTLSIFIGVNQSIYRFGDVVGGTGERWEKDRDSIRTLDKFKDTVLQDYFNSKETWDRHEMHLPLLYKLCSDKGRQKYSPSEALTIHFRNGDNKFDSLNELVECAQSFTASDSHASTARLVTIQHYGANADTGAFFATPKSINKGNQAVEDMIDQLQSIGLSVKVQSSEDPDVDFCTLVHAKAVCLSKGGFDSVVRAVRDSAGITDMQRNFRDVMYFLRAKWTDEVKSHPGQGTGPTAVPYEGDVYSIGDAASMPWAVKSTIQKNTEYKGTVLRRYFDKKAPNYWVDGRKYYKVCAEGWSDFKPHEDVVMYYHGGNWAVRQELLYCARTIASLFPIDTRISMRIITAMAVPHVIDNPKRHIYGFVNEVEQMGYRVTIQETGTVLRVAADLDNKTMAMTLPLYERTKQVIDSAIAEGDLALHAGARSLMETFEREKLNVNRTTRHLLSQALAAASDDVNYCTTLLANRTCTLKGDVENIIRVVRRKVFNEIAEGF